MKLKDASYDALVEKHMHSHKQMTPEETKAEIEKVQDGAMSSFENAISSIPKNETVYKGTIEGIMVIPKKRGRPKGSKNKPK